MAEVINAERVAPRTGTAWWKNEDWLAVGVGLIIIAIVLAGARPGIPKFAWTSTGDLASTVFSAGNLAAIGVIGLAYLGLSAIGVFLLGRNAIKFAIGFPVVFGISLLAQVIAGNSKISYWGVEYVIFAVLIGILISNTIGVPDWLQEAVRTEFYIKVGLVILGAGILIHEILQAGLLGIAQAFLVVTVVWSFGFWLAKKLKLDDEFAVILASAVSICGVSAAIAACGAIKGDQKKLSYVTSLVLIVAIPMIVLQPWIIKSTGIPDAVGGAWLGGTLDTTGSVVAAGSLISEVALKIGTIVKFSQNVLIGLVAFLLSLWWAFRKREQAEGEEKPSARLIWERFPKFVLGFIVASLIFSFLLSSPLVKETKGLFTGLRTAWFALAFTSIGLETRFVEFIKLENGRPAIAFIGAQAINIVWTLLIALLLFSGLIFSVPQVK